MVNTKHNKYFYELEAESEHSLILLINQSITVGKIPFDSLEIITNTDSINLNSQAEFFEAMMERSKDYYSITVE